MTPTPTACQIDDGGRCRRIIINAYIPTTLPHKRCSFLSICAAHTHTLLVLFGRVLCVCVPICINMGAFPFARSVRWHCAESRHPANRGVGGGGGGGRGGEPTDLWYACTQTHALSGRIVRLCLCGTCDLYMFVCVCWYQCFHYSITRTLCEPSDTSCSRCHCSLSVAQRAICVSSLTGA